MGLFIISFDLHGNEKDYNCLYEKLKSFPEHLQLLESSWLVKTPGTSERLLEIFSQCLDSDDQILIAELTDDIATQGFSRALQLHIKILS